MSLRLRHSYVCRLLVARLEGEVIMAALARKVKSIEITGEEASLHQHAARPGKLPVTIKPA